MQQVHHRRECSHRLHRRAGSPSAPGYFLQLGAGLLSEAKVGLRASQLLLYLLEANLSRACVNCSLLYAVTGTKLQAHEHMTFQTVALNAHCRFSLTLCHLYFAVKNPALTKRKKQTRILSFDSDLVTRVLYVSGFGKQKIESTLYRASVSLWFVKV